MVSISSTRDLSSPATVRSRQFTNASPSEATMRVKSTGRPLLASTASHPWVRTRRPAGIGTEMPSPRTFASFAVRRCVSNSYSITDNPLLSQSHRSGAGAAFKINTRIAALSPDGAPSACSDMTFQGIWCARGPSPECGVAGDRLSRKCDLRSRGPSATP